MTTDQARLNLNNFLSSYTHWECIELLNQVYDQVAETISTAKTNDSKEKMLDFLEALEELIPVVYSLPKE